MKPGPIGIHLGEDRIKLAQIAEEGNKLEIVEMISIPTPKGAIAGGLVKTPRIIGEEIGNAINAAKFSGRKAIVAIPSEIMKVTILNLPDAANLDNAVAAKISQMSFEHPEEMTFDYKIVSKAKDSIKTIVVITNKTHVQTIRDVVAQAKLIMLGTDLEMLSIFRLTSQVYQTDKKPVVIALFAGSNLKLALFVERVLSSIKTTSLETPRAMLDPKLAGIEVVKFVEDYSRLNLVTEPPMVFLSGLPNPSFAIEKAILESTGMITTSTRWSQAFSVSQTYTDFPELRNRFGAFACAIGLSMSDLKMPVKVPVPMIIDPRQDGFRQEFLAYMSTED